VLAERKRAVWSGRARLALVTLVLLAVAVLAATASGAYPSGLPNWPAMLPPDPADSGKRARLSFDVCPSGSIDCPDDVIDEMYRRWRPLDRRCDHRAVFALTYLRTTEEFLRTERRNPRFFSDNRWINHEDAVFAELYFRAYDRYFAGRPVPAAWRIAFETNRSGDETAIGDLLLGMNAHINRDLPYTLAHVGLVKPRGASRKPDHDRVNAFLDRVIDPVQRELARRYDPMFTWTDAEPSPLDEVGALQMVRGFRENAWRNAERLVNADTSAERSRVRQSIEAESEVGAQTIRAMFFAPGYGATRDAHCRARSR
jgi:hypothetical protein